MSLPEKFGRYQVLDVLGQGAMGLVYKAVDPVIERGVAIKVIQADPGLGEGDLERMQARFEQEFRSAGALSHANIVTIFDVGKEGDLYYIAMEYVQGRSLDTVLGEKGVLSFKEVSDLTWELSSALDYAHAQGVVHRDIKPANVLITGEGRSKITDFGLAKLEATTLTRTGALVGTPAYMSPEQVGGQAITGKTDQFSLGILLYQALTGERPFTGDSPSTIMYKIVHEEALPPGQVNRSLPEAVDGVLLRALDKNVDRRYDSCLALADGLRQALGASPVATLNTEVPMSAPPDAATIVEPPPSVTPVPPVSSPHGAPVPASAPAPTTPPQSLPPDGLPAGSIPPSDAPPGSVPPSGVPPISYVPVASPATPRWLLTTGILLPSVALLAMVAWFISQGFTGGGQPSGEETLAAGTEPQGAEGGANPDDPGAGDADAETGGDEEQAAPPAAATPEDLDAVRDEFSAEVQELREQVAANQRGAEVQEPEGGGVGQPAAEERPASISYSVSSDPEGAVIFVDGTRLDMSTPTDIELATDVDHEVEIRARGYEPYRYDVRMVGIPTEDLPPGLHVGLSRVVDAAAANPNAASRGGRGNRGNRAAEGLDDIPAELRQFIESNNLPTGRIAVRAPYAVGVLVRPGNRAANMTPLLRRRMQDLPEEVRRRIMGGFVLRMKQNHDFEMPAGLWRVTLMAPRVLYVDEREVFVERDQRVDLSDGIPVLNEMLIIEITSDPPGAQFRVDGLPNRLPTPHNGPIVPGLHVFEFFWGSVSRVAEATVQADIDRAGQSVVGRRQ